MRLVSASKFAEASGISIQSARKAFAVSAQGKAWRGHVLPVVQMDGVVGGNSGKSYCLVLDAAPEEIRSLFGDENLPVDAPSNSHLKAAPSAAQYDKQREKLHIIEPILATQRFTPERKAAYDAAFQKTGLPEKTLRNWVGVVESNGPQALLPRTRSDKGKKRVLITREWDNSIGLSDEIKKKIASELEKQARSMIATDGTSRREVKRLSEFTLQRLSSDEGTPVPLADLPKVCKLNDPWVKQFEVYRLVHIHDKDHKRFQDKLVPRIRRELHDKPMDLLMGDVHYMDISVIELGVIRVRLIAWMDMASLFLWVTPVFLSKGQGIRQEDVAQSLAQVTMCPFGGIPKAYSLDNGSEYAELPRVTQRLGALADMMDFKVHLAKAYSPQSKGDIENAFHILQGLYQSLDGYIGGDRTNKKSENKGKVVQPYRKGLKRLESDIIDIVRTYNDRPQSGRLQGLSPIEAFERAADREEFAARVPDDDAFDLIFSREDSRVVRQGCIKLDHQSYRSPELDAVPYNDAVQILIPLRNRKDRIFVRHRGKDLGWAKLQSSFAQGDTSGAVVQRHMERELVNKVNQLRKDVDPQVATLDLQKRAVRKVAPNVASPEIWTNSAIDKTGHATAAERQAEQLARAEKARRAEQDQVFAEIEALREAEKRVASGGNR